MAYFIKKADDSTILPKRELLSAVFLIALDGSKILAIQNDRGWEIPGGHIEDGETAAEALVREVQEEAGATFSNPRLAAIIESSNQGKYKDKVMLVYATDEFILGKFTPSEDALAREVMEIEDLLAKHESVIDLAGLIKLAREAIGNNQPRS